MATLGKLFFTVTGLANGHRLGLGLQLSNYFNVKNLWAAQNRPKDFWR
jgi:hypothetical protein